MLESPPRLPVASTARAAAPLNTRVRRVEGAPVVAFRAWLPGGARLEEIQGQSLVTGRMLVEGSHRRDWQRIALESEERGMSIGGFGGFEGHGLALEALADDWETALEWAAELLLEPSFPADRCEWTAEQAAAELDSYSDQPEIVAGWRFLDQLYRPHPRCRPLHGDRASLMSLRPKDCARLHQAGLARGPVVAVAGRIDEPRVVERLTELFGEAGGAAPADGEPPAPEGMVDAHQVVESPGTDQAHLYLGHLTIARRHPDHPALSLLGVILGSGPGVTGRIPERIRERDGLAYTAWADAAIGAGRDPGRLAIYLGTSPETVERAETAVRQEIGELLAEGATEQETEAARAYLLGREPFRRETARQWADILLEAEITGMPVDRADWLSTALADVDRDELNRVAREQLSLERLKVTVGLPAAGGAADRAP